MPLPNEIADRAAELTATRETNPRLRDELNSLMRAGNVNGQNAISSEVSSLLERQGVLPQLVLQEAARLNADGQGGITRQDLNNIINDRTNRYDPTTVLAAQYAARNFAAIDDDHWYRPGNNTNELTIDEIRNFADGRRTASPPVRGESAPAGRLPYDQPPNPENVRQMNIDILNGSSGTAQTKFAAIEAIARTGQNRITLTDVDGRQVPCRIEVSPISPGSDRNYVHLYATDGGRERILLRAIGRNGEYTQQVGNDGNRVSFTGSEWSRRFPTSNLGLR